jgi:hypothetical protein
MRIRMKTIASIVGTTILFLLTPVLIVSLVKLPFGLEIKLIIFSGFLVAILITALLFGVVDKLTSILMFTRTNYIANETKRLDPDNNQPAMNILKSDLDEEKGLKKLSGEIVGGMSAAKQWLIVLVIQGGLIFGLFHLWP